MLESLINGIRLVNFTSLDTKEIKMIYNWRNNPKIAKYMINKSITWDEHLGFIDSLKNSQDKIYFLVYKDDLAIGVISFINISKNSCEFGIYASPDLRGMGDLLMGVVVDYAFNRLCVKEILAKAFMDNLRAITLYKKFEFNIIKKDKDMVYFSRQGGVELNIPLCQERLLA